MFKKLLLVVCGLVATMGFAFAQVDVNKADQVALDGIKGIGPKTSKAILDERKKGGDYKDWADFAQRVKGIGDANAAKLSQAGLTVNGKSNPGISTAAVKTAQKDAKADAKRAKKEGKAEAKEAQKEAKQEMAKK